MSVELDIGGDLLSTLPGAVKTAKAALAKGARGLWWPDHVMGWFPAPLFREEYGAAPGLRSADALLDPFVVAGAVASAVALPRAGTAVTDAVRRHPATLLQAASSVATTGSEFVLGIGAGASENTIPYALGDKRTRFRALEEAVNLIRMLRDTDGPVTYEGERFHADGAIAAMPEKRSVKLWIGGTGPKSVELAANLADGWLPTRVPPEEYATQVTMLHEVAARAGRPAPVTSMFAFTMVATSHEAAHDLMQSPFLKALLLFRGPDYYHQRGLEHPLVAATGSSAYIPARLSCAEAEQAVEAIPDDLLHDYLVHGTPEEVRRWAALMESHGMSHAVLYDLAKYVANGSAASAALDLFGVG